MELQRMLAVVKNPNIKRETLERYTDMLMKEDLLGALTETYENLISAFRGEEEKHPNRMPYYWDMVNSIIAHPKVTDEILLKLLAFPFWDPEVYVKVIDGVKDFENFTVAYTRIVEIVDDESWDDPQTRRQIRDALNKKFKDLMKKE